MAGMPLLRYCVLFRSPEISVLCNWRCCCQEIKSPSCEALNPNPEPAQILGATCG
jgi:hypothetical protein